MSAAEEHGNLLWTEKGVFFLQTFFCVYVCPPIILKKFVLIKAGHYKQKYLTQDFLRKENLPMGQYPRFFFQRETKGTTSLKKKTGTTSITGRKISVYANISVFHDVDS